MDANLTKICQKEGIEGRTARALSGGQVNSVFLVDDQYVVRIGARQDAYQRLSRETEVLKSLAGVIPVPRVYAFGQMDGLTYQVQQYLPGQKLIDIWRSLRPRAQEKIIAELAEYLKILHHKNLTYFGHGHADTPKYESWSSFLADQFKQTCEEIHALKIRMAPGFPELAADYFDAHRDALQDGAPVQVHGDLTPVNVLVNQGKISAILDFEYGMQAPKDYELWAMEAFCLYPNDYAEEGGEVFCAADLASIFQYLKKYYAEIFETPHLRERVNLYQIEATLSSYLSWRKDNFKVKPPEQMAAKDFYMARITNFIFERGVRMFL